MKRFWQYEAGPHGVSLQLVEQGWLRGSKALPVSTWLSDESIPGVALLRHWLDRESAVAEATEVLVPHAYIAELSEPQASQLQLPPAAPHALSLSSGGTLDEPEFELRYQWLRYGTLRERLERHGALVRFGDQWYRLPMSIFRLVEAVDRFNAADTSQREARVAAWEPIQEAIREATGETVRPDGYLADLQILHGAAFSLTVDIRADGIHFDPVLFGKAGHRPGDAFGTDVPEDGAEGESTAGIDELIDEGDSLLPPDVQEIFLRQRFGSDTTCRWAYPLQRNQYVVLDEPLRRALDVVKHKQRASEEEKRAFLRNPRAVIAEALELPPDSPETAGLFLETEQYAERVRGIQLWERKVLPWLAKSVNSWLPERLGLRVGETVVEVEPERVGDLRRGFDEAERSGAESFTFDNTSIPVTPETNTAISYVEAIAEQISPATGDEAGAAPESAQEEETEEAAAPERFALETADNLEELGYLAGLSPRRPALAPDTPPPELLDNSRLLAHQREGFQWMVRAWRQGLPGVLLADDMGLGKTLQALAFAAWIAEHHRRLASSARRGPILIVAPTALLRNWQAEHDKHLANGGLGQPLEVYGSGVKRLKRQAGGRRDIDIGAAELDREQMRSVPWMLTTYETLANYHFSFAAIPYPLVIFDEIQKIKTPNTINTHAAKTLNADFVIGLTGTPVENRLSDLWSIMDRVYPGFLGDLQSFSSTYDADDVDALKSLHEKVTVGGGQPSVMLRRMKGAVDLGDALPPRETVELPADMPPVQADAYTAVIREASKSEMLSLLHGMRGVSLHPRAPGDLVGVTEEYERYIGESARLAQCIEALDKVRDRGEKALVYIERRDMQELLADIVRHRYRLTATPPVINGQTPSARRQAVADAFQNEGPGFSMLILAPRAAGVGLTLHAANHVIHLSRWWNPAVEDQCNDRVYRIGQRKPVTVYCPIARHPAIGEHSFDVKLNELLQRKRRMSRDLLMPAETQRDYEELFQATTAVGD